jgi:hypothetical protein
MLRVCFGDDHGDLIGDTASEGYRDGGSDVGSSALFSAFTGAATVTIAPTMSLPTVTVAPPKGMAEAGLIPEFTVTRTGATTAALTVESCMVGAR